MNCKYCGKKVVLVPSAKERAEKYGGTPDFYAKQFPHHADCVAKERSKQSSELMAKLNLKKAV